jgi:hypothetical protein
MDEVDVLLLRRDVLFSDCNEAHYIRLKLTLNRLVESRDCLESKMEKCQANNLHIAFKLLKFLLASSGRQLAVFKWQIIASHVNLTKFFHKAMLEK